MKFTKATDYAFVLLKHLHGLEKGKTTSVKKVSEVCDIPKRFLANIVHSLSKSGVLLTVKGMDGGIRLAKSSDKITIKDVVEVMEGTIRFVDCQTHKGLCQTEGSCNVKNFWDVKLAEFISIFENSTVADIAEFEKKGKSKAKKK